MPPYKQPGISPVHKGMKNNIAVGAAHSEGTTTPVASSRGGQTLVKRVQDACTTDEPRTPTARADDERTARENRMDESRSNTPAVDGGQEVRSAASGDGNDGQTPADAVTNMSGQGVSHDGGSNAERNDIDDDSARENECDQIQGGSGVVNDARDVGDDVDGHGGGLTSPDPSGSHPQYMRDTPDARRRVGLKPHAEVDIHDCVECNEKLRACGSKVIELFRPCDTHLNELYRLTDAYGTHCLNPGHDERHRELQAKKQGGGISFRRYGKLSDFALKQGLKGRKTLRFDRENVSGFCSQCSQPKYTAGKKRKQPSPQPQPVSHIDALQRNAVDSLEQVDVEAVVTVHVPVKLRDIDATKANCDGIREHIKARPQLVAAAAKSWSKIEQHIAKAEYKVTQDPKNDRRFYLK